MNVTPPPRALPGILQQLGPGLIITASIVGSGELIMTTKLGSEVGFRLLWYIILGCMIKVFVQIELGRYTIARGITTLATLDSLPGPRLAAGWMVYAWLAMTVCTSFQLAGILGGIAGVFETGGSAWHPFNWAIVLAASCAILLGLGRYRLVERSATTMVALFTLFTIFAVGGLYWTPYALSAREIVQGLTLHLPEDFTTAFAAFGIIGVGASELIYYPYWCLEKGYARYVGPPDGTPEWTQRAHGWLRVLKADAWVSMAIYTTATVAFYLLGAAVLNRRGIAVTDKELISDLSHMYSETFGNVGLWVFLLGAFVVLYSTFFVATASNARLFVDAFHVFRLLPVKDDAVRQRRVRWACVALPAIYFVIFVTVRQPVKLVTIGAIAQGAMLPPLCWSALYLHLYRIPSELKAGAAGRVFLWIAAVLMTTTGLYEANQSLSKLLHAEPKAGGTPDGSQPADPTRRRTTNSSTHPTTKQRDTWPTHLQKRLGFEFVLVPCGRYLLAGDIGEDALRSIYQETVRPATDALVGRFFADHPSRVTCVICGDRQSYRQAWQRLFGKEPPVGYGTYHPAYRVLAVDWQKGRGALVHELVHALIDHDCPHAPVWLHEGLASLYETIRFDGGGGEPQPARLPVCPRLAGLQLAIHRGQCTPLDRFFEKPFTGPLASHDYALARYLCLFLDERDLLVDLYHRVRDGAPADRTDAASFASFFPHRSPDELERAFYSWLTTLP